MIAENVDHPRDAFGILENQIEGLLGKLQFTRLPGDFQAVIDVFLIWFLVKDNAREESELLDNPELKN